ncbi:uncharacterized protein LOC120197599 [Hibiscus syriacus]|uniref:uncharacterized protein LOC120197599 n=1 Tax=Hibiscus syriacus TaxID=106335 RepID=UPI001922AAB2|nr:uncharacterized protein LOC120197599 [Hibiscus syriacus]
MAISQLPLKDLWSFTVPCNIGDTSLGKYLFDLGTSINLMPLSIFKKFGSDKTSPTTVTLQLANHSTIHPSGIVENMLVQVEKLIFLIDFIILDCKVDKDVLIIFGRPFLAIGRDLIDVEKGELTMCLNDEHITFNALNNVSYINENDECFSLDVIDIFVHDHLEEYYSADTNLCDFEAFEEFLTDE